MSENTDVIKKPLVSIGITTFKRPHYLEKALQSAINQTYENLEIVVSNDCSPDSQTELIIKNAKAKDSRIKYFYREQNTGAISNLNFVVQKSNGEYFMWLSDDDWIDSSYVSACLKFIMENSKYALVTGKTKFYSKDNFLYEDEGINALQESPFIRILSYYDKQLGTANCPCFGLMKRQYLINCPLEKIQGHDNILIANISFIGKIQTLEDVYIHRRFGGVSQSLNNLALQCGYPSLELNHPYLALGVNILKDIAYKSPVYKSLGPLKRICLAFVLCGMILLNLGKYLKRYKKRFLFN